MRRALDRRLKCLELRMLPEHRPVIVLAIFDRDDDEVIGLRPLRPDAPMILRLPGESLDALKARAKAAVPAGQFAAFMTAYRPKDAGNVAPSDVQAGGSASATHGLTSLAKPSEKFG